MIFRRVGPSEDAEKYIVVRSGCRWLCVPARKLHVTESFANVTRRLRKTARRVHYRETILHDDPVSFICSLNSYACMGEYSRHADFRVCVHAVYLRASYSDTYCLFVRGLTLAHRYAVGLIVGSCFTVAFYFYLLLLFFFRRNCGQPTRVI